MVGPAGPRPNDNAVVSVGLDARGSQLPPQQIGAPRPGPLPPLGPNSGSGKTAPTQTTTQAQQTATLQAPQAGISPGGSFGGVYRRSQSTSSLGTNDGVSGEDVNFTGGSIVSGRFSATLGSSTLSAPVVAGISNFTRGTSSPFGAFSGFSFVTPDNKFVVIEGNESGSTRKLFAFAGVRTTTFPTAGATFYKSRRDFVLGSNVPFLFADAGGSITVSQTGSNAAIFWDTSGSATAQRPFGAFTSALDGLGSSQKSAVSLAIGQVTTSITGAARGSSFLNGQTSPHVFTGSLASLGDGASTANHFFGGSSPSHFVLGAASSTSLIEKFENATSSYKPNTVFTGQPQSLDSRTNHLSSGSGNNDAYRGYTGGVIYELSASGFLSGSDTFTNSSKSPSDITIQTSIATNKVAASFDVTRTNTSGSFVATFGDFDVGAFGSGSNSSGNSAFIDDNKFGARENPSGSFTAAGSSASSPILYMVSADVGMANVAVGKFSDVNFCSCAFLTWGLWGGEIQTGGSGEGSIYRMHAAPWVAGVVTPYVNLPMHGSATYTGHVMANVVSGSASYLAAGNLRMGVDFATPSLTSISVTNFDGGSFSGTGINVFSASGLNKFSSGTLTGAGGQAGRTANMNGSFFQNKTGTDVTAGVGGQFTASGTGYKAGGAFAAQK
ncbi:MAG: hypothetical protein FJX65_17340 [Alphaproteobacteria bacterium]|nr:hypothetical protein [Alphaproteobacteria bacterium]